MYISFYKPYLRAVDTWNIKRLTATIVEYFGNAPVDLQSQTNSDQVEERNDTTGQKESYKYYIKNGDANITIVTNTIRSSLPRSSSL